jgi:hypothetical protein
MGLFLPSVPKFVDENSLAAARPYELVAGHEISLECNLFVRRSKNIAHCVREYIHINGLIPPPPKPEAPPTPA